MRLDEGGGTDAGPAGAKGRSGARGHTPAAGSGALGVTKARVNEVIDTSESVLNDKTSSFINKTGARHPGARKKCGEETTHKLEKKQTDRNLGYSP